MEKERKKAIKAITVVLIFASGLICAVYSIDQGYEQRRQEELNREYEKTGKVFAASLVLKETQTWTGKQDCTVVIFEDWERIRFRGLHPEIEHGQIWSFKYTNSSSFRSVKILKEKQLLQDNA